MVSYVNFKSNMFYSGNMLYLFLLCFTYTAPCFVPNVPESTKIYNIQQYESVGEYGRLKKSTVLKNEVIVKL